MANLFIREFFLIALILPLGAKSQTTDWDFGSWYGVSITKNWTKKWSTNVDFQTRLDSSSTALKVAFTDVGVNYSINKVFSLSGNYRYGVSSFSPITTYTQRGYIDFKMIKPKKFLFKTKRINLSLRVRGQVVYGVKNLNRVYPELLLRPKLTVQYDSKKMPLKPYLAAELFLKLNEPTYTFDNAPRAEAYFEKHRITTGVDWSVNKHHSLRVFYILQGDMTRSAVNSIIGVGYEYELPKKKKKKLYD